MEDELAKEEFSSLVEVEPISFESKQDLWPLLFILKSLSVNPHPEFSRKFLFIYFLLIARK